MQAFLLRLVGLLLMLSALAVTLSHAPDRSVESLVAQWAPPPSDFMIVKGQLVHYRDEGPRSDAVPIVLLHGTASSLHTWEGWVAALRPARRVITFDLPGSGLTGPFAGEYAHERYLGDNYARFTLDVLGALHVDRFVIGGNSLGGEVAWRVAGLAQERVDRLILVDASGYAFTPAHLPLGFQLARLPVFGWVGEFLTPRAMVEDSVRDVYGDPSKVTSALVDRYFEMTLREGNRRALTRRLQAVPDDLAPDRIRGLRVPTLILWGGRDRLIPPDTAQRFLRDIPGSRLVLFPELGHVPQEENPAETVAAVRVFLGLQSAAEVPGPARAPSRLAAVDAASVRLPPQAPRPANRFASIP
jgi:pimeloyl-ACP methyl ester carboxylesterase